MIARVPIAWVTVCLLASGMAACSPSTKALRSATTPGEAPREVRFAVLPVNSFVPIAPELSGAAGRTLGRITRYLAIHGRERVVVEPEATKQLWLASIVEANSSDEASRNFTGAIRVFARELRKSTVFDALIVPSLVYRPAKLYRRLAKWDGVARRLPKVGEESVEVPESYRGVVSAVSLHVMVFDVAGELVFENYGGLDLAQTFALKSKGEAILISAPRESVLKDHRQLNDGVELAFEPYLPRFESKNW